MRIIRRLTQPHPHDHSRVGVRTHLRVVARCDRIVPMLHPPRLRFTTAHSHLALLFGFPALWPAACPVPPAHSRPALSAPASLAVAPPAAAGSLLRRPGKGAFFHRLARGCRRRLGQRSLDGRGSVTHSEPATVRESAIKNRTAATTASSAHHSPSRSLSQKWPGCSDPSLRRYRCNRPHRCSSNWDG